MHEEWIDVAGWYKNEEDGDGWSTTSNTNFVSAYAHGKNPEEDFAESLAAYILSPEHILSVAPEKHDFIEDFVMGGTRYVSSIREDLQFEVLNLNPDYYYPGKIIRVYTKVEGAPMEDKKVTVEIELLNKEGIPDGAVHAQTRLFSSKGQYHDLGMYPKNGNPHILTGSLTISKYSANGYWSVDQIRITDQTGNKRFEGKADFGFLVYIDNPLEDLIKPKYIEDSLNIDVVESTCGPIECHELTITWDIEEENPIGHNGAYIRLVSINNPELYSIQKWGKVENNQAKVVMYVTEYYPQGQYTVAYLKMMDKARNFGHAYFGNGNNHNQRVIVNIETSNPDTTSPSIQDVAVQAEPTNPDNPDGETRVTIAFCAKDDIAGVGRISYYLQDPQGKRHHGYLYHRNSGALHFHGNVRECMEYQNRTYPTKRFCPWNMGLERNKAFRPGRKLQIL